MTLLVAVLALVLAVVLAGVCAVQLVLLRGVRRRAEALAETVAALEPSTPLPADLEASLGAGTRRVLVIDVLNPLEIALSRNRAAGVLAAMAPERLRRIVLDQAAKEMAEQMATEGLEVEVSVHAAR